MSHVQFGHLINRILVDRLISVVQLTGLGVDPSSSKFVHIFLCLTFFCLGSGVLSWIERGSDVPGLVAEVSHLDIMPQIVLTLLLLLYFSDILVLTEDKSRHESLGNDDLVTQALVFDVAAIELGPLFKFFSSKTIVEVVIVQGPIEQVEGSEGSCWLGSIELVVLLHTNVDFVWVVRLLNDVPVQVLE